MSELTDKAKGLANEAIGKVKQGVGDLTGSDKTKAEGAAQEAEGHTQKAVGDAKGAVKDTANKVADATHNALNR
ncbi:MAG: CsbD family protein [Janthinobacterium lividum]